MNTITLHPKASLLDLVLAAGDSNCRVAVEYCELQRQREALDEELEAAHLQNAQCAAKLAAAQRRLREIWDIAGPAPMPMPVVPVAPLPFPPCIPMPPSAAPPVSRDELRKFLYVDVASGHLKCTASSLLAGVDNAGDIMINGFRLNAESVVRFIRDGVWK
jgi:hypothetical protein